MPWYTPGEEKLTEMRKYYHNSNPSAISQLGKGVVDSFIDGACSGAEDLGRSFAISAGLLVREKCVE